MLGVQKPSERGEKIACAPNKNKPIFYSQFA